MTAEQKELDIYIEQSRDLYPLKLAIVENLQKKIDKGIYNPALAPRAWIQLVQQGAKGYAREYCSSEWDARTIFSTKDKRELAARYAEHYYQEIMNGNYRKVG